MYKQIGKIAGTFLGVEDHGILTCRLDMRFGGSAQSVGGYAFDEYVKGREDRVGVAFGMEFIRRTLLACSVDSWEKLVGRTIYVLRESDAWGAKVIGIGPLPTEEGQDFLFDDLRREFYPEKAA